MQLYVYKWLPTADVKRAACPYWLGNNSLYVWAFLSQLLIGRSPRWEQISPFMGVVMPREEVSKEDKHKGKSSDRHLIFTTDKQKAGEGFLQAGGWDFHVCSSLFPSFWALLTATEMITGCLWRQKCIK